MGTKWGGVQGSDTIRVDKDWYGEAQWAHGRVEFCDKALAVLDVGDRLYGKYTALRTYWGEYEAECLGKSKVMP